MTDRGDRDPTGSGTSLLDQFAALADPRQVAKALFPLPEILLMVLAATLAGADDFVEVRAWSAERPAFLRRFLPYANGVPSHDTLNHDTLNNVVNALDPALFKRCLVSWVEGLRGLPARARRHRRQDLAPLPCPVQGPRGPASGLGPSGARGAGCSAGGSAQGRWADDQRLVLGQEAVAGKSSEITAIPLLLGRLELAGALVTIDAIGCQTRIARAILARQADCLLAVKANWPGVHAEIVRYFEDAPASACDRHETTDGDHGRIEIRRRRVTRDVAWLTGDRRHPGEPRFPGLQAIAMVEAEVERAGTIGIARRYFLSSMALDAATFARAVRALGHREPPALGPRRRLPRRSRPPAHRPRPREHGHRPPHGPRPRARGPWQAQPQGPSQEGRLEPRLSPNPPTPNRLSSLMRSPWVKRAGVGIAH